MTEANPPSHDEPAAKPGCILGILFGAVIGGSCAGLLCVLQLNLTWNLKSGDFLTAVLSALGVLLAAISVLLAVLAIFLAVGAVYGWEQFNRRTGDAAARKAADIAGPAAAKAAVPAAIQQVDDYLNKNLDREIRQKITTIVTQVVTPGLIKSVSERDEGEVGSTVAAPVGPERGFSEEAVKAAAAEERDRQEDTLQAFDNVVEAVELRNEDQDAREDDV